MGYKYILFDLDGTLTDSAPGITNSAAYALKSFGIDAKPSELTAFVGPPLIDSFKRYYGMDDEQAKRAVTAFREYFVSRGMFENNPYPGVADMLAELKAAGKTLIVATSKPEPFAKKILAHFGLDGYFDLIAGSTLDETRTEKTDVIAYAIGTAGLDTAAMLMVGDRCYDIDGAHALGIDAMGVLYGYGTEAELSAAEHIASTVADISRIIISLD